MTASDIIASTYEWRPACDSGELEMGEMFAFSTNDKWIVVYRVEDGLYATDNVCSHAFALLSDGWLEGETVECPLHGALFNIKTGAVERGPAECSVGTYKVKEEDGLVYCYVPVVA